MWRCRRGFVRGRGQGSYLRRESAPTQPNALGKWLSAMTDMNARDTSEPDASLADRSLVAGIVESSNSAVLLFLRDAALSPSSSPGGRGGRAEAAFDVWGPFDWLHKYTGPLVSMPARRVFLCGLSLADFDLRKVLIPGQEIVVHLTYSDEQHWRNIHILQEGDETNILVIYLEALWFIKPRFDSPVLQWMDIDSFFKNHQISHQISLEDMDELSQYFAQLVAFDFLKSQTKQCQGKGKEELREKGQQIQEERSRADQGQQTSKGRPQEKGQQQEHAQKEQQVLKQQKEEKQEPPEKCQQQVNWHQQAKLGTDTTGQEKGKDQPQEEGQQQLKDLSGETEHPQAKPVGTSTKLVGKKLLKSQTKGKEELHEKGQQIQEERLQDQGQQNWNGRPQEKGQQQEHVQKEQEVLKEQPEKKQQQPDKCQQQVKWHQQGKLGTDTTGQQKEKVQPQEEGQQQLTSQSDEKGHPQSKPVVWDNDCQFVEEFLIFHCGLILFILLGTFLYYCLLLIFTSISVE